MTIQEIEIVDQAAAIWNKFLKLLDQHADDVNDFRRAVHDMQRIVYARALRNQKYTDPVPGLLKKEKAASGGKAIPGETREILDTTTNSIRFGRPRPSDVCRKVPTMKNPPPRKERAHVESVILQIPRPDTTSYAATGWQEKKNPFWLKVLVCAFLAAIIFYICVGFYKHWE